MFLMQSHVYDLMMLVFVSMFTIFGLLFSFYFRVYSRLANVSFSPQSRFLSFFLFLRLPGPVLC